MILRSLVLLFLLLTIALCDAAGLLQLGFQDAAIPIPMMLGGEGIIDLHQYYVKKMSLPLSVPTAAPVAPAQAALQGKEEILADFNDAVSLYLVRTGQTMPSPYTTEDVVEQTVGGIGLQDLQEIWLDHAENGLNCEFIWNAAHIHAGMGEEDPIPGQVDAILENLFNNPIEIIVGSPLDPFSIHPIIPMEFIFSFTNPSLFMLLTLGLFLLLLYKCRFFTIALCDAAEPWQLGFQDAATPMMQGIIDLHHDIFFFLILILVFVLWMLVRALWHFNEQTNPIPQRIVHGTTIEIIRTILPSVILLFIAIPSFALLYSMDGVLVEPVTTIKAIGHQWYWTYEYSDYNSSDEQSLTFDSYMIPEDDPELGQSRLLEVDNRVVVPAKTLLRMIVTSADVLHSWAVPSLGVKCDAVPGRLNLTSISVQREGVYYGQCSEICGTNHAFMPIVVEAVTLKDYADWVSNQLIQ